MVDATDKERRKQIEERANARDAAYRGKTDKTDPTASELLEQLLTRKRTRGGGPSKTVIAERLNALCLTGHPPSEYLRALASRARESDKHHADDFYETMAIELELWADE